jgi:hypothetical protein
MHLYLKADLTFERSVKNGLTGLNKSEASGSSFRRPEQNHRQLFKKSSTDEGLEAVQG